MSDIRTIFKMADALQDGRPFEKTRNNNNAIVLKNRHGNVTHKPTTANRRNSKLCNSHPNLWSCTPWVCLYVTQTNVVSLCQNAICYLTQRRRLSLSNRRQCLLLIGRYARFVKRRVAKICNALPYQRDSMLEVVMFRLPETSVHFKN